MAPDLLLHGLLLLLLQAAPLRSRRSVGQEKAGRLYLVRDDGCMRDVTIEDMSRGDATARTGAASDLRSTTPDADRSRVMAFPETAAVVKNVLSGSRAVAWRRGSFERWRPAAVPANSGGLPTHRRGGGSSDGQAESSDAAASSSHVWNSDADATADDAEPAAADEAEGAAADDDEDAALLQDVHARLLDRRRMAAELLAAIRAAEAEHRAKAAEYERKAERAAADLAGELRRLRQCDQQLANGTDERRLLEDKLRRADEQLAKARAQLHDSQAGARELTQRVASLQSVADAERAVAARESERAARLAGDGARAAADLGDALRQLAAAREALNAERENGARQLARSADDVAALRRNATVVQEAARTAAVELAASRAEAAGRAAELEEERRRSQRNAAHAQLQLDLCARQNAQLRAEASDGAQRLSAAENEIKELKYRLREAEALLKKRESDFRDCLAVKTRTFCGFEDGSFCGFQQDANDNFNWALRSGRSGAAFKKRVASHPEADHTCASGDGNYIYARPGAYRQGSAARIISPRYSHVNTTLCFSFWYYIFGRSVGLLNVHAVIPRLAEAGGSTSVMIWSTRGQGHKGWYRAYFDVPPNVATSSFHIVFEAISGGGGSDEADIAVDDVSVTDGSCSTPSSNVASNHYDNGGNSNTHGEG